MSVGKKLRHTLEMRKKERDSDVWFTHQPMVSFIQGTCDEAYRKDRTQAVPTVSTTVVQKVNEKLIPPEQTQYLLQFWAEEGTDTMITHVPIRRIVLLARALGIDNPDMLISEMTWKTWGEYRPVMFEVLSEGWVLVAPYLTDNLFGVPRRTGKAPYYVEDTSFDSVDELLAEHEHSFELKSQLRSDRPSTVPRQR